MAASVPTRPTTISNSRRVKPFWPGILLAILLFEVPMLPVGGPQFNQFFEKREQIVEKIVLSCTEISRILALGDERNYFPESVHGAHEPVADDHARYQGCQQSDSAKSDEYSIQNVCKLAV